MPAPVLEDRTTVVISRRPIFSPISMSCTRVMPILALAAALVSASAQQTQQTEATRRGVGDTSIFAPLKLSPAPTVYRSASGAPGPTYWQNRADYALHATLDPATKSVSGTMMLRYTNHSPDTLTFLWIQTEQNAFRPNSLNSMVFPAGSRFGARGVNGGDVIERSAQIVGGKQVPLTRRDNGTVTKVELARPLAPEAILRKTGERHHVLIS